jgi:hypothetical protein
MASMNTASMHPMLSSVVHLPFRKAALEVGCCEFAQRDFTRHLTPHDQVLSASLPMDEISKQKLWHAMLNGEVIAVELVDDEILLFHVRGHMADKYVDMRFAYEKDVWHVIAVTSIHQRPVPRAKIGLLVGLLAVIVASGLTGYFLSNHSSSVSQQAVTDWASVHGYHLVKTQQDTAAVVGSTGAATTPISTTPSSTSVKPASRNFVFDFKPGMTVHDISLFLQQKQLIPNAYDFDAILKQTGVDKQIWPGTYHFTSTMNQTQILQVLKSQPSR